MKMIEIHEKAKKMGIKSWSYRKFDLIRKIQLEEGNEPCFRINNGPCGETGCCWRADCLLYKK